MNIMLVPQGEREALIKVTVKSARRGEAASDLFSVFTNLLEELKRCFRLLETDCFLLGFCSLETSKEKDERRRKQVKTAVIFQLQSKCLFTGVSGVELLSHAALTQSYLLHSLGCLSPFPHVLCRSLQPSSGPARTPTGRSAMPISRPQRPFYCS